MANEQLAKVSNSPARHAIRYAVKVKGESEFVVLVHRGSVPREKIGSMIAMHESVEYIRAERAL